MVGCPGAESCGITVSSRGDDPHFRALHTTVQNTLYPGPGELSSDVAKDQGRSMASLRPKTRVPAGMQPAGKCFREAMAPHLRRPSSLHHQNNADQNGPAFMQTGIFRMEKQQVSEKEFFET